MQKIPIAGLCVDMDGTLCLTEHIHETASSQFLLDRFGFNHEEIGLDFSSGHSYKHIYEALLSNYIRLKGVTCDISHREFMDGCRQKYLEIIGKEPDHIKILQDMVSIIVSAKSSGAPSVLVTNSPLSFMEVNFRVIEQKLPEGLFIEKLYLECFQKSKPDPDPYQRGVARLNQYLGTSHPVHAFLAFEDSNIGIESAINAGLWVIARPSTSYMIIRQELRDHPKVFYVPYNESHENIFAENFCLFLEAGAKLV
jgi:beta-phosphoglucomutase-like phosphatase (HAD superfamily)